MRISGYFSKPEGSREQKSLGKHWFRLCRINHLSERTAIWTPLYTYFRQIVMWTSGRNDTRLPRFSTYLLTPRSRVLLEKLPGFQLLKKFPAFYATRRFITTLTSVRHLSLSWASSNQSVTQHPTSWRSVLILFSHLCLCLQNGLFPSGFPTKILYTPLLSAIRVTRSAHLILDLITRTILGKGLRSATFENVLVNQISLIGLTPLHRRLLLTNINQTSLIGLTPLHRRLLLTNINFFSNFSQFCNKISHQRDFPLTTFTTNRRCTFSFNQVFAFTPNKYRLWRAAKQ